MQKQFFVILATSVLQCTISAQTLPTEPVNIGHTPQFVCDNYIIDNYWPIKYKREVMVRVLHPPTKYKGNPVMKGDGGYVTVLRDIKTGMFNMWYQTWVASPIKGKSGRYAIAYAESKDGITWKLPKLGLYKWEGTKENNIVWTGHDGKRGSQVYFPELPEKDKRGYRFIMLYGGRGGGHLVGSQDGIHWDKKSVTRIIPMHSDTHNALVYDPKRKEYVLFCRAKHIYRTFRGKIIDTGSSRRVARMANKQLWELWKTEPQNILVPDELDAKDGFNFFYGMPVKYYAGIYWGFLWPFKMNSDIDTELAWSRDGIDFQRLPTRPKFVARGKKGAWDHGMVFSGYQWVEMGDEWWMYYAGWDGPHGTRERTPGIGLMKMRKDGFIAMRGPKLGGGVLCTRKIRWPVGELSLNVDAADGEVKVRVTDAKRKPLPGFDYDDCVPFRGDDVAHIVRWKKGSIASLAGRVIRLEIFLRDADLFTFRAANEEK